ncbi:class I SAM-dependent methyltransferase [uncultured Sneathiella sp.]|jgi:SAM-dependent methyltransferase|uniref:class I SAM-dependent methyltransferase n=1 Tax=uncultured Sneathiella sp. TaxID=879315 RepID=UPI0030DBC185|tara:strand:- start:25614 stop:26417 length:804 start_codon:yes stop_codon:yes gene_type:complete
MMKKFLKKVPILGPMGYALSRWLKFTGRRIRGKDTRGRNKYLFRRLQLTHEPQNGMEMPVQQITNLLNYTKASPLGQGPGPKDFPASLSMNIRGYYIEGSRNPEERLDFYPQDWTGKTVLDLGCNHGGMLLSIADKIKYGIGVDYDPTTINVANKVKSCLENNNLDFYVFNLENEDINLIRDFIPDEQIDVTLLLAVCAWIKNGSDVIDFVSKISKTLLFEANGTEDAQQDQISSLRSGYKNVELLYQVLGSKNGQEYVQRRLFFCY